MSGFGWIGPVEVEIFDAAFSWQARPLAGGLSGATLAGLVEWPQIHQLRELVNNPDRRLTVGGATGVLEYVWAGDELLAPFRGWYLLSSFNPSPGFDNSREGLTALVPFQLEATYLGDQREVVVSRSARARANDFDLNGQAAIVTPFWGEDSDGQPFIIDPGGTFVTREYDPTSPHDSARLTPTDGARHLGLYVGTPDELDVVALPDLEAATDFDGQAVPRWITDRGGDCRAFDRREEREVFGPSHPLTASTDLVITNGLVRAWVGARGLPPYLQVQALRTGEWREVGYVHLADPTDGAILKSARLVRVTPDAVGIAIGIQGKGDAVVTLRRGERMLRVQHGSSRTRAACDRRVLWAGLPPWSRLVSAGQGDGKFGKGLDAGRDDANWDDPEAEWDSALYSWDGQYIGNPDLRLWWPPEVRDAYTLCGWYRPSSDVADLNGAGLVSAYDSAGPDLVLELLLDSADLRFKATVGGDTVQSAVQTFSAGDDVFWAVRFSTVDGLALSVKAGAGALAHVADPAAVDPGTTAKYRDIFFGASDLDWGDGDWGDGSWGGVTWADGVQDNVMIFDGYLSDAEVAGLAAASTRLAGLPTPEASLVWHLPGDAAPILSHAAMATGRVVQSAADDWGLTRAIALLTESSGAAGSELGVAAYAEVLDVAALLATTGTKDSAADQHAQFAAAAEQEVRVR